MQAEFAAWTTRINALGLDWTQKEFEAQLKSVIHVYNDVRREITDPFRPYYHYFGTMQGWQLFPVPHMYPSKLHVDIFNAGRWQAVYVNRDAELDWQGQSNAQGTISL